MSAESDPESAGRSFRQRSTLFGTAQSVEPAQIVRGLFGVVLFSGVWWAAGSQSPSYLLPTPPEVAVAFREELLSGALFVHLGQSLRHYVPGVTAGITAGTLFGVAVGWSSRLAEVCQPVIRILRPIPPLAWIVFAILWFGLGHASAAFLLCIGAFWITFYNAYSGVQNAADELLEAARTLGVGGDWQLLRRVVLPEAAPSLLTGVRVSLGRCWMMLIAAELFGAPGLGFEIVTSANNLAMDRSLAYVAVISAVYMVSDAGVAYLERLVLSR